jgi:hypothetical protein
MSKLIGWFKNHQSLKILKLNLPYILSLFILLVSINITINVNLWKDKQVIKSDVISYYGYLPATFIYHDYTLKFLENYQGPHQFTIWPKDVPNGGKILITSMGMSFLYAPFFFIADNYSIGSSYDTGGYSEPYQLAIVICTLFYFAIGLFYLCKLLLRFFNPIISSLVVLITVAGSNLFYYATFEPGMSHPFSFTLITMFIWFSIKWYDQQRYAYAFMLGILIGLISLIRPTNIIVALFFIFYDVKGWKDFIGRLQSYILKYKHLILIAGLCFFVWFPQLLYWKSITGSFFYYSYGEENKFFFNHPQILKGFFSYRNGWLVYSPAMVFSVLGLFFFWKRYKELQLASVISVIISIYVIFSWWCWWYGGAFGNRAMIDLYGLLALSAGVFFSYMSTVKHKWMNYTAVSLALLLTLAGMHHINKRRCFSIHYDSMTKEAFWDSYFQYKPSPTFEGKLRAPDYIKARQGIDAYETK